MGRPRKDPEGSLRVNAMFRMTEAMRERLAAAASASGFSMSEQIERIIEAHFAAADQRALIREEVRAALVERDGKVFDAIVPRERAYFAEKLARNLADYLARQETGSDEEAALAIEREEVARLNA